MEVAGLVSSTMAAKFANDAAGPDWLAEELATLARRWSRKPAVKRPRPA